MRAAFLPRKREDAATSASACSSRVAAAWKRLISASISRYRGRASVDHDGNSPPMPRAPAYSSPLASSRTDIDMSVSWVAMPSSSNSLHSVG